MRKSATQALAVPGLQSSRATLELAIDSEYYVPGAIEQEDDKLIWNWTGKEKPLNQFDGLLNGFVSLHDGPDERILAYARQWGVLCGCPEHKRLKKARAPTPELPTFCLNKHPKGHGEPLANWRASITGIRRNSADSVRSRDRKTWCYYSRV